MTPGHGGTTCPWPATVTPPDTTKPRARPLLLLDSRPWAPSRTITFVSRIVFSTTARRLARESF
jgi:hypothetical protein